MADGTPTYRRSGELLPLLFTTDHDAGPAHEPAAPVVRGFADTWPTLSVEVRRDVAGALLTSGRVRQDKTVEIFPCWGEPVTITFTKRGSVPHLPTD